jgi:hypothetical protein
MKNVDVDVITQLFPCPCCGYLVHALRGMSDVCIVCSWQDSEKQLRDPYLPGAPNELSLWHAQRNIGKTQEGRTQLSTARETRKRHREWRPIVIKLDDFGLASERQNLAISDYSQLYYWAQNFWNFDARANYDKSGPDVDIAHCHSSYNRLQVERSKFCGCYYCCSTFESTQVSEWIDDGLTPICPHCSIDSVLASDSGYPLTIEFLTAMRDRWF